MGMEVVRQETKPQMEKRKRPGLSLFDGLDGHAFGPALDNEGECWEFEVVPVGPKPIFVEVFEMGKVGTDG